MRIAGSGCGIRLQGVIEVKKKKWRLSVPLDFKISVCLNLEDPKKALAFDEFDLFTSYISGAAIDTKGFLEFSPTDDNALRVRVILKGVPINSC